jgi:type IV pilus assembly protein PilY1
MKSHTHQYTVRTLLLTASAALSFLTLQADAATDVLVADTPLFLSAGVKPNLIMAIDDSGSMDFETLLAANDGSAWFRTAAASGTCVAGTGNSFVGCEADGTADFPSPAAPRLNFNNGGNSSGTWKKFSYLFPNGCNGASTSFQRRLCDNVNDHFAIPPIPQHAWARSSDYNSAYFDPFTTYAPWPDGGGLTFTDANPAAARFDPVFGTGLNSWDLTRDVARNAQVATTTAACNNATLPGTGGPGDNFSFRVFAGMTLPEGTCFHPDMNADGDLNDGDEDWQIVRTGGGGCAIGVANGCRTDALANTRNFTFPSDRRVWIRYFPATFYLAPGNPFAAKFGYTASPLAGRAPDGGELEGFEIKPGNFSDPATYAAVMQNFANWFTFYRKRHQALRAGLGQSFQPLDNLRVAGFRINGGNVDVAMRDLADATAKDDLYTDFYQNWVNSGGTPNRAAVANIMRNFRRTNAGAPVTSSCQRNFGMLFTDGFSNPPAAGDGFDAIGNVDGARGAPYADGTANTMADGAMAAFVNNIRPDLPTGKLTLPAACGTPEQTPSMDCNANLHVNFFALTLGARGILYDPDKDYSLPAYDPYIVNPMWPTLFPARNPAAVDDLWHATINGRGKLLTAQRPAEVSQKFSELLQAIADTEGTAASASVNSGSINTDTRVFQAKFDPKTWAGKLTSFGVLPDGTLEAATGPRYWEASAEMPTPTSRVIFTVNSDGSPTVFSWDDAGDNSLDATRKVQLVLPDPAAAPLGIERVAYLRGQQSFEQANGGSFRDRPSILGDIINSSPAFVGKPSFFYRDSLESEPYSTFRAANATRRGMVYAGANDGMLHAFDVTDGSEKFAFIPGAVFKNLHLLTDPSYAHRYYVDGSPTAGDAFINGNWRSVLVGGLNAGGQSIYALDITDPSAFTETSASANDAFLWEFTDANDADLGFSFSRPAIVRMHNGKWAAIFGNGYSSTKADTYTSATGNAVLFIVDLETGALVRKIDTGVGAAAAYSGGRSNGLATPAVVDANGDQIADYAYAGDLFGNLWKFDLRDAVPANWDVAYKAGANKFPVFVAERAGLRQPITVRPEVSRGPNRQGFMLLFGTGKYLEPLDEDIALAKPQSFYGVWDNNTGTAITDIVIGRSVMLRQEIEDEFIETFTKPDATTVSYPVRQTTQNPLTTERGWYLDLISPANGFEGERQTTDPVLRNGRIIFTTLIPNPDVCGFGGDSWLMEIDALSGARLKETPFDLNADELFNADDYIGSPAVPASGLKTEVGITPRPAVISGENAEYKFMPGTSGQMQVVTENPGAGDLRRQSWRQVR